MIKEERVKRIGLLVALSALTLSLPPGAPAGATPGRGAADCRGGGTLFCENFDRLPVGGASSLDWGIDTRNGTLTVERRAAGSGKVLHVRTRDNGRAFLRVDDLAAPATGFYGRMRLRVDAFPTAPDWAHFTLVEATGPGSAEVVRPVGGQYVPTLDRALWGIGADGGPTGDWTDWSESAPAAADVWQCVEWRLDPVTNTVTTWIGGDVVLRATERDHGGNAVPFVLPTVDTVKIGWQLYQPGTTPAGFDLWIDDVALSTRRLGC
ncbi:hypothetical protein FHX34_102844 [Actinoplanes teichomyceticus]|uniref:Glycosyl hydrolase family 16 n=2 Tax=Actinoplanes teichomyceticus TaxID=1867 RepID=A0A561WK98_ACTTI|nr:hypothetical protein FHX34_102844 [Actinoplanes teichomyceticus]GIF12862.1 hypothetical protein Ate01nite_28940 [Actinoplanes teichomyceticus]